MDWSVPRFYQPSAEMAQRIPLVLRLSLVLLAVLIHSTAMAQTPLRLGVFSPRPVVVTEQQWSPLADYLADALGRPVVLQALEPHVIDSAVSHNQVDLLLTNPAHYVFVRSQSMLANVLATVISREDGQEVSSLGGVIVTLAERNDIDTLQDLPGKRIGAPGTRFLGGFQVQAVELLDAGLSLPQGEQFVVFGQHDAVIEAVLDARVDVGFVRTGIIETLAAQAGLDPSRLKVINPQNFAGFPYRVSTRLYPEWAFVAMPSVDSTSLRHISTALLTLDADHPAARAAGIGGFMPPADYTAVDQLARRLRVEPYDVLPEFTLSDVWQQYKLESIVGALALTLILALSLALLVRHRQLGALTAALQQAFSQREELVRHVPGMLYQFRRRADGSMHLPYASEGIKDIFGVSAEQVSHDAQKVFDSLHADDRDRIHKSIQHSASTLDVWHEEWRVIFPDGRTVWVEGEASPEKMGDGSVLWHGYIRNVTQRKKTEENLRLAANVFTHAREGIIITDPGGVIVDVNPAFSAITGYQREEVLGQNPSILKSGRQDQAVYSSMWQDLLAKGHWDGEIWNRRKDGREYAELMTISSVYDESGEVQNYIAVFSDITALKNHQADLERMAHYDSLTGLPNRLLLADRLRQAMVHTQRRGTRLAVCFLDLDGFKAVNDQHGHAVGDEFLAALASRMSEVLREGDTLARPGGDEFVAVLADLADIESSVPILNRLIEVAAKPVMLDQLKVQVTASVGVTFYPQDDGIDADHLLRQADQAMYQAKQAGKHRYYIFDAEQDRSVRSRHESLQRLRQALTNREFVLYYQPKVNMRTGQIVGAEALIRWAHPERGILPPVAFLPVIEGDAFSIELGEWVIDSALAQIEAWHRLGYQIPVSANVGAMQLQHPEFAARLRRLLGSHPGVRPADLSLEVLETSALEDFASVANTMRACQDMGVGFALDDFGTGYSSLSYLKGVPAKLLKIDRSFVRDMLDDPDDLAILEGVVGLARAFSREVIAEGVESTLHGEMLLWLGCELAQGYAIARPMPAEDFPAWADTWTSPLAWQTTEPVDQQHLPMLFAIVEHRAWISAVVRFLEVGGDMPAMLDEHMCRFGYWLDHGGRALLGIDGTEHEVEVLHRSIHRLVETLIDLKRKGADIEVQRRVGELHTLRDALFTQITALR